MVSIVSLWLPILLSAVFVFIVSSFVHMVLPHHKNEFKKLPDEDGVMDTLRKFNLPPGEYNFPHANDMKEMGTPEFKAKLEKGPAALITVMKNEVPSMTGSLITWFIYSIVVSIFAAYVAGRALVPGADYLAVFRFTGVTAFLGYSLALVHDSIWYKRAWSTTFKYMIDGLLYALVTAGTFGWLWVK
ncbi:MAG: hypothetical protein K8H86_11100 [Ignavibacteriaceae bacterium]|nr:hypothetical protein [Ignavibacteriaceae bacterium]